MLTQRALETIQLAKHCVCFVIQESFSVCCYFSPKTDLDMTSTGLNLLTTANMVADAASLSPDWTEMDLNWS